MGDPNSDRLVLYFIPSPFGLSWRSPHSINRTSLLNGLGEALLGYRHSIGHVNVEIVSPSFGRRVLTGMTARERYESSILILKKRYGMGVLFHAFQGRLEEASEIDPQLIERSRSGKMSFLEFLISPAAAARLLDFYDGFFARRGELLYGFPCRPRRAEGGGCSEFAASFLELAGLMDEELKKHWTRTIRVPDRLIGGPETGAQVSLLEVLGHRSGGRWATEEEAHRALTFWDPEAMHEWVKRVWREQTLQPSETWRYRHVMRGKARGFSADRRNAPVPTDPIWQ